MILKKVFRSFGLSKSEINFYNENGYLALTGLVKPTEISLLKLRAREHIDSWKPDSHPTFLTDENRVADDYFMKSAYKISFFFEDSVKPPVKDKFNAVNKIGHALHDLDNVFRNFSYRKEFKEILSSLDYKNPQIVQSMYILKSPKIGGVVTPHQDCSYIISEPSSCIGVWVALDDARPDNACMYAAPGSHKQGTKYFWEKKDGKMGFSGKYEYSTDNAVCLEAKAGTVILLHGNLVHWSSQNYSEYSRHAYTLHVVDGDYKWSEKNWLQRPEYFPFRTWS